MRRANGWQGREGSKRFDEQQQGPQQDFTKEVKRRPCSRSNIQETRIPRDGNLGHRGYPESGRRRGCHK
ncbi:hypothetical protein K443DRAFT_156751 [Laccaria amethystina LaAM-08-1]|uniref:Uncharacterized protein n=1 Tax=Laccaria amethystina LaAM-08-1 TaxID=1095629 RepID=A0A0C9XQD6_9AGAR|nr:hypothetical protein K443DRAFT_156751 [Laccaria amethystina LaAM-08-1]